jgi:transglutaminase-like putative cysteine protease
MTTFRIRHRTHYDYDGPVALGLHRLMIRPRDGHDMRILESSLVVSPAADVRWSFDTFGNSVTFLTFQHPAEALVIDSELTVRRYGVDEPLERIARHAEAYPVAYDADDSIDLAPLLASQFPGDRPSVEAWLDGVMPVRPADCLEVLNRLGDAIHHSYQYGRREERGTQAPGETIALGRGTCRDFALLFMEAARRLGFAARFVTGYLYDPGADGSAVGPTGSALTGGGSTHAWADVFIPGVGWTEFDPTNRIVAGRNLLRVATTRTPSQALPVSGVFKGSASNRMSVEVGVWRLD